jgi:hypothetical protein
VVDVPVGRIEVVPDVLEAACTGADDGEVVGCAEGAPGRMPPLDAGWLGGGELDAGWLGGGVHDATGSGREGSGVATSASVGRDGAGGGAATGSATATAPPTGPS